MLSLSHPSRALFGQGPRGTRVTLLLTAGWCMPRDQWSWGILIESCSVHILVSAPRTGSVTNSLCKHVPGRQAAWTPLSSRSGAGLPAPSLSLFWPESSSLRSWGSLLHVLWVWIFLELLAAVTSANSLPRGLLKILEIQVFYVWLLLISRTVFFMENKWII